MELKCIAQNIECDYYDVYDAFFEGLGPAPEAVCPELNTVTSICLAENVDEINEAQDD